MALLIGLFLCGSSWAGVELKAAKDCRRIEANPVKQLGVPRCYHEGLYYDGKAIWLCNGEGGNVWIVDTGTGEVLSEITPVAGFCEAVTAVGDGTYFTTEWYEKKVYRVGLKDGAFNVLSCVSVEPSHPAGAVWNGKSLYVITWDRGVLGTKFGLLEMDGGMNVLRRIPIKAMQEPCQLAWDGANLWMSSWFDQRVYRIDTAKWEVTGSFRAPVGKTTGLAWDGRYLWLTATYGDLYQMEIGT
jgi:outer membrane protein assembly factor BamB